MQLKGERILQKVTPTDGLAESASQLLMLSVGMCTIRNP
jgi:hypothetical protein